MLFQSSTGVFSSGSNCLSSPESARKLDSRFRKSSTDEQVD
jgi:hypothetical protein